MNKSLMNWYKATNNLIKDAYSKTVTDESLKKAVDEWVEAIKTIELACPGLKEDYERQIAIQESFTSKQIDFICEQIGEWYYMMKPLLEGSHNLGHMKEKLKKMICGEGENE